MKRPLSLLTPLAILSASCAMDGAEALQIEQTNKADSFTPMSSNVAALQISTPRTTDVGAAGSARATATGQVVSLYFNKDVTLPSSGEWCLNLTNVLGAPSGASACMS